jgi:glyoxylase-like metal-dependent hydrolase (beta-lactamase superfamily II)
LTFLIDAPLFRSWLFASESIDNAAVEQVLDLAPGLWIWRLSYPDWHEAAGWPEVVTSTCVESGGEVAVLDPLAPPEGSEVWERLDAKPPTMAVVLKPDHVRDVDLFVSRYGARAFGPWLFWRNNIPQTELEPIEPGSELPGGLLALYEGRGRNETPLWLPEQRTLVFADALIGASGELRIWGTPHIDRARPALRELLELPFERVIVAHGEPVHDRAAFERALDLPGWSD